MNKELKKERLLELLADQTLFGLSVEESRELAKLQTEFPELTEDSSFEKTALAISLSNLDTSEEMPHNLQATILRDADEFFDSKQVVADEREQTPDNGYAPVAVTGSDSVLGTSNITSSGGGFNLTQWLGWGVAALACIALVANIWLAPPERNSGLAQQDREQTAPPPKEPTIAEKKQKFLASADDLVKTEWSSPDESNKDLAGEIAWSDAKQEGYMTFRGLPVNDTARETYQLWIFRDEKLEPHPIDGGVFDVNKDGEVIVPIDAKLKVKNPKVFAVTVEKPGGVVVSGREKIAALAKVQA